MNNIVDCKHLAKTYIDGELKVTVLTDINLNVQAGERVAILGRSGSGKSTLLHLLGGLDKPSGGNVYVTDQDIHALSEKKRCQLRNQKLGFIYQFHHLLPEFTALENVAMPLLIRGKSRSVAKQKASQLLFQVGLGERLHHKPAQLSGGERQRTAIARALVTEPACLLADEPTGNLDHHTASHVADILFELNTTLNTSLIIATHDLGLAKKMDRILQLDEGVLASANLDSYVRD